MNSNNESKAEDLRWIARHAVMVLSMLCAFFILWLSFEYPSEFRVVAETFAAVWLVFGAVLFLRYRKKSAVPKE